MTHCLHEIQNIAAMSLCMFQPLTDNAYRQMHKLSHDRRNIIIKLLLIIEIMKLG